MPPINGPRSTIGAHRTVAVRAQGMRAPPAIRAGSAHRDERSSRAIEPCNQAVRTGGATGGCTKAAQPTLVSIRCSLRSVFPGKSPPHWRRRLELGDRPAYLSIADLIAEDVRDGRLGARERLPTLRELAGQLQLNYTTVARAYAEARRRGLIDSRPGVGTYVRGHTPALPLPHSGCAIACPKSTPRACWSAPACTARWRR